VNTIGIALVAAMAANTEAPPPVVADHGHLAADQIGRKGRQSIMLVFCKTVFDRYVAAVDIAGFTQATAERR
jgi:hypothetical protein